MSRSPQEMFDHVAGLTELYLLDDITDEQLTELEALIRSDKQAAQVMRTVLSQAGMMRVVFNEQRTFASNIGEVDRDEYLALLQTLQPTEEPELVHIVGQIKTRQPLWQQWPVIMSSVAAVAAIALTISLVFQGNTPTPNLTDNTDTNMPAATTQSTPRGSHAQPPVATITATNNAVWATTQAERASARGSHLSVGSPLHPNQRLTLTQGFAEITTNRGAIAILEAPCVVELKDNDNGLRLVTGKLVGICETESSKGFLVRTPHMDVTDLGTRFGVDASQPDATEVHVFEGEVRVDRPATGSKPAQRQALTQGQAVRASAIVDATSDRLVSIPPAPDRFTLNFEKRLIVASGRGKVSGEIDPNWHVVAVDGQPVTENGEMTAWSDPKETVAREASKWIRVNNALNPPGKKRAVFTCRSTFELPKELDTAATELRLRLRADHTLAALRINGQELDVPKNRVGIGPEWLTWTLTQHFVPGKNTVELKIEEIISLKKEGSSGLRAEIETRRR